MVRRIFWRRGSGSYPGRRFFRRRATPSVAGGATKSVAQSTSRNAPIYAHQPVRVAHRKLMKIVPIVSTPPINLLINSALVGIPGALATAIPINAIEQNTGLDKRSANKVWMQELQVSHHVSTIPASDQMIRYTMMVFYDRESRGSTPSLTDVINSADAMALQNVLSRERFDILYRQVITFAMQPTYDGTGVSNRISNGFAKIHSVKIPIYRGAVYNAATASVGAIDKGTLWLVFFNNTAPAGGNASVNVCHRLTFVDID